jgi:hypothetical protein
MRGETNSPIQGCNPSQIQGLLKPHPSEWQVFGIEQFIPKANKLRSAAAAGVNVSI